MRESMEDELKETNFMMEIEEDEFDEPVKVKPRPRFSPLIIPRLVKFIYAEVKNNVKAS